MTFPGENGIHFHKCCPPSEPLILATVELYARKNFSNQPSFQDHTTFQTGKECFTNLKVLFQLANTNERYERINTQPADLCLRTCKRTKVNITCYYLSQLCHQRSVQPFTRCLIFLGLFFLISKIKRLGQKNSKDSLV